MRYDIHSPLPSLRPSIPSIDLYPSYGTLISTTLCHLYGLLSPILLYGPLSLLRTSVPSTALCSLYGPLSPLEPSVCGPFTYWTALCLMDGPLVSPGINPGCLSSSPDTKIIL